MFITISQSVKIYLQYFLLFAYTIWLQFSYTQLSGPGISSAMRCPLLLSVEAPVTIGWLLAIGLGGDINCVKENTKSKVSTYLHNEKQKLGFIGIWNIAIMMLLICNVSDKGTRGALPS